MGIPERMRTTVVKTKSRVVTVDVPSYGWWTFERDDGIQEKNGTITFESPMGEGVSELNDRLSRMLEEVERKWDIELKDDIVEIIGKCTHEEMGGKTKIEFITMNGKPAAWIVNGSRFEDIEDIPNFHHRMIANRMARNASQGKGVSNIEKDEQWGEDVATNDAINDIDIESPVEVDVIKEGEPDDPSIPSEEAPPPP